jgi:Trk K+ transport system NAD-binding subunit
MLEREVIGTIPVKRRVLLLADVPVNEGSPLAGRSLAEIEQGGGVRVVSVDGGARPPVGTCVEPGQRLIVVATRSGLGRMLDGDADGDGYSDEPEPAASQ